MNTYTEAATMLWGRVAVLVGAVSVVTTSYERQNCRVDDFTVQPNFDLEKFLGKWYEIKWILEEWIDPEENFSDFVHTYSVVNDTIVDILATGRISPTRCISFHNYLITTDESAKLIFDRNYNATAGFRSPYWVILTDYDNYAMVYGCRGMNVNGTCAVPDVWVWSRKSTLSPEYESLVDARLPHLCVSTDDLVVTEQNNDCDADKSHAGGHIGNIMSFYVIVICLILHNIHVSEA